MVLCVSCQCRCVDSCRVVQNERKSYARERWWFYIFLAILYWLNFYGFRNSRERRIFTKPIDKSIPFSICDDTYHVSRTERCIIWMKHQSWKKKQIALHIASHVTRAYHRWRIPFRCAGMNKIASYGSIIFKKQATCWMHSIFIVNA